MNHEPKKECFKTSVGGQALMEGIMMRGPKQICCAVRKPDGTIETKLEDTPTHGIWTKIPLVRGAISMVESLIMGYRYMMYSAQVSMGDDYDAEAEESAFEKWVGDHLGKDPHRAGRYLDDREPHYRLPVYDVLRTGEHGRRVRRRRGRVCL